MREKQRFYPRGEAALDGSAAAADFPPRRLLTGRERWDSGPGIAYALLMPLVACFVVDCEWRVLHIHRLTWAIQERDVLIGMGTILFGWLSVRWPFPVVAKAYLRTSLALFVAGVAAMLLFCAYGMVASLFGPW